MAAASGTVTLNVIANDKASQKLREIGEKLTQVGTRMAAAFTLPIVGAFALAVKNSKQLQDALKPVETAFTNVSMELGNALVPLVRELTPSIIQLARELSGLIRQFNALPIEQRKAIGGFIAFAAAAGPVVAAVGQVVGTVGTLQQLITAAGPALAGFGTWLSGMGAAAYAALGPVGALLLAITALITLLNSDFGQQGITAGKQLLSLSAYGAGYAFGGEELANKALISSNADLGIGQAAPRAGGRSGTTVINNNNYGVSVTPQSTAALKPYLDQYGRDTGRR